MNRRTKKSRLRRIAKLNKTNDINEIILYKSHNTTYYPRSKSPNSALKLKKNEKLKCNRFLQIDSEQFLEVSKLKESYIFNVNLIVTFHWLYQHIPSI